MSSLDLEITIGVIIEYERVSDGCPERGPTYDCAGTPAEPPEYEFTVFHNGHDITALLTDEQLDEIRTKVADDDDITPEPFDDSD